jgi:hypothetical protein
VISRRIKTTLAAVGLTVALLTGCATEPPPAEEPATAEPISDDNDAPPLGAPRPKLTPGDVLEEDDE